MGFVIIISWIVVSKIHFGFRICFLVEKVTIKDGTRLNGWDHIKGKYLFTVARRIVTNPPNHVKRTTNATAKHKLRK
jgi:hypothetical protein